MKTSPWLSFFALLLITLPHVRAHGAVQQPRPNILVILCDDLGLADYSAFGTKDVRTPHIDSLFQEGMTFCNFRANSCVCSPTRAALLTGCYPDRVGVPGVIREEERGTNKFVGLPFARCDAAAASVEKSRVSLRNCREMAPWHQLTKHTDRAGI